MSALAATYKFTVEEYYRLYETGIFDENDRIELLNGELLLMHAIGQRHLQGLTNLNAHLGEKARRRFMISPQNPVELDEFSAPQPDIVLVPWSPKTSRRPHPEVVFLIIEVADSSLRYDREEKMRAYAAVGIREYWILNLQDDVFEVHREPEGNGYREVFTAEGEGTASPLAFPDVVISLAETVPAR